MIYIDDRTGSKEFLPLFRLPASISRLQFADFHFMGGFDGRDGGREALIGIERKTIPDLLSSIDSGRLGAYQIPGMISSYDFVALLIEGAYKYDENGTVCYPQRGGGLRPVIGGKKPHNFQALEGWLNTARFKFGIQIIHSSDMRDSARQIERIYSWFQKPWEGHKAIGGEAGLRKEDINERAGGGLFARAGRRIGVVERMAAQIPGVGAERAVEAGKVFKTPLEMCLAGDKDWQRIKGIGAGTAKKAVEVCQSEGKGR